MTMRLLVAACVAVLCAHAAVVRSPLGRKMVSRAAHKPNSRKQFIPPVMEKVHELRAETPKMVMHKSSNISGVEGTLHANMVTYYVDLDMGSPAATSTFIFDTGSSLLWIGGEMCMGCTGNRTYNPLTSTTAALVNCNDTSRCTRGQCYPAGGMGPTGNLMPNDTQYCGFDAQYGTAGSGTGALGYLVEDRVAIAGLSANVAFGVATSAEPADSVPGAGLDGLLGMAFAPLGCSPNCLPPLFDSLVAQNDDITDSFTMDMRDPENQEVIFGQDEEVNDAALFTDIVKEDYYEVELQAMKVGDKYYRDLSYPKDFGMSIVDSGTTEFLLSLNAYRGFLAAMEADYCDISDSIDVCGYNGLLRQPGGCVAKVSHDVIMKFPTLTLQFAGNATVDITPDLYLRDAELSGGGVGTCLFLGTTSTSALTIIGDPLFYKRAIVFDRGASQVGFLPSYTSAWTPPEGFRPKGSSGGGVSGVTVVIILSCGAVGFVVLVGVLMRYVLPTLRSTRRHSSSGGVVAYATADDQYEREALVSAA